MAMPTPASVASLIVTAIGTPPLGVDAATANWTAILSDIQTMISAGVVATTVTGTTTCPAGAGTIAVATGTGSLT